MWTIDGREMIGARKEKGRDGQLRERSDRYWERNIPIVGSYLPPKPTSATTPPHTTNNSLIYELQSRRLSAHTLRVKARKGRGDVHVTE